MNISISNLAWGKTPLKEIIPKLAEAGIQGIEIAPTAIWSDLDNVRDKDLLELKRYLEGYNLSVSGLQSLLYSRPELQLFEQNHWNDLKKHLEKVIRFGGLLSADVAVFGSPKNRLRGHLDSNKANELATRFFRQIESCLMDNNVVLTLEPNAKDYGADFLTTYEEVVGLSRGIDSPMIKPQIDTGCLWMSGEDPAVEYLKYAPHHIHVSTPNLGVVPGKSNFEGFIDVINNSNFPGWVVVETLNTPFGQSLDAIKWLKSKLEIG